MHDNYNVLIIICEVHINRIIIQHIDTLPIYGKKRHSMYVGPRNVYPMIYVTYKCKPFYLKGLWMIFSIQTVFCYQCVEL